MKYWVVKLITPVILSLTIVACGDEGKGLFSSWAAKDGSFVLDLTSSDFGTNAIVWLLTNGDTCSSTMVIGGTESSGTAVVSGTTGSNAACATLDGSYTFTKTDKILTICLGSDCTEYE